MQKIEIGHRAHRQHIVAAGNALNKGVLIVELREIPPRDWSKTLKELDLNLSFDLHIRYSELFIKSSSDCRPARSAVNL